MSDENVTKLVAVYVRWEDSHGTNGWIDRESLVEQFKKDGSCICETLGWVVEDTPEYLLVASSVCAVYDKVDNYTRILRRSIIGTPEVVEFASKRTESFAMDSIGV